jgi:hypothetical protein
MVSNSSSGGKKSRLALFIFQAMRGVVRDRNTRRNVMFVLIVSAIVLVFAGSTFLQAPLNPGEHPLGFLLFWIACGWLTLTAFLLGISDLLIVKLEARNAGRRSRQKFARADDSVSSTIRAVGCKQANRFGLDK